MADKTGIQWTDATWNPIRGCSRVSNGCTNCYAEKVAKRFSGPGQPYEGLVDDKGRWNGVVRVVEEHLGDPLRWQRPRMVFVNSMSDLFHEGLSNEDIAAVFAVMAASPRHTFQVLTKRPQRMLAWFQWLETRLVPSSDAYIRDQRINRARMAAVWEGWRAGVPLDDWLPPSHGAWPLPNVWLGVSVENQQTADERIPLLLQCPAAVRWVSYEPALGPVDFREIADGSWHDREGANRYDAIVGRSWWSNGDTGIGGGPSLDWIVVGGESGPDARQFDVGWAGSVIEQCRDTDCRVFVKQQLGAKPYDDEGAAGRWLLTLRDRKGGDMSEWPEHLRVREWPEALAF